VISIAKLGVGTAQTYYRQDFSAPTNRYYSQEQTLAGQWQGKLAAEMGLVGSVTPEQYDRLTMGQHPHTGEQLVEHRDTKVTQAGKEMAHVAAYDIVFRPGKSISLAGLVGGDERLVKVVTAANDKAMAAMEEYVQQRMGGNRLPQTTAKWIVATFQHDTSRPVDGYAAPLIHHHNVVMNLTCIDPSANEGDPAGQARSLWTKEIFKAQTFGEAVYQSEIARGAGELGYEIKKGPTGAAEVAGFSKEYLDAESPRSKGIAAKLEDLGLSGSVEAAKIVAKDWRESKQALTPDQVRAIHRLHGEAFGDQAQKVVAESLERGPTQAKQIHPEQAVEFARHRLAERSAVFEHYEVVRDALRRGHGAFSVEQVEAEVKRRIDNGGLVVAGHVRAHAPAARYSTPEQLGLEQDTIERMKLGQNSVEPILAGADLSKSSAFADNPNRQRVLEGFLKTTDQITGMNGAAGSAKSSSLAIIAEHARKQGFTVQGLAPTGTAADALSQKGIRAATLQKHLVEQLSSRKQQKAGETFEAKALPPKVLYLLDEASLVSSRQMNGFLRTLRSQDQAILIGDDAPGENQVGQHTAVEAGRPFQQLQTAGMKTAHLNRIYRQKEHELKQVVQQFRAGHTAEGLHILESRGAIQERQNRNERYQDVGKWFALAPESALVVSPDNHSRQAINAAVREELRATGYLKEGSHEVPVLVQRDVTGMDRTRAENYRPGDVLRYVHANETLGVAGKSYATVIDADPTENKLTVKTEDGRLLTHDPSRTGAGVAVFESRIQKFAIGEHVQFTAPDKDLGVTNRNTGVIRDLDANGNIEVVLNERGRAVKWNLRNNRHLDYAYTSTSHSAQSRTVDRCAVQVDTDDHRLHALINRVFTYVAGSRPEYELAVFTDNKEKLARVMGREHEIHTALAPKQIQELSVEMRREDLGRQREMEIAF
jgi:conjugative relaxase-like TrwC/TraI family protein